MGREINTNELIKIIGEKNTIYTISLMKFYENADIDTLIQFLDMVTFELLCREFPKYNEYLADTFKMFKDQMGKAQYDMIMQYKIETRERLIINLMVISNLLIQKQLMVKRK